MKYSILIFAILGLALAEVRPLLNFFYFYVFVSLARHRRRPNSFFSLSLIFFLSTKTFNKAPCRK